MRLTGAYGGACRDRGVRSAGLDTHRSAGHRSGQQPDVVGVQPCRTRTTRQLCSGYIADYTRTTRQARQWAYSSATHALLGKQGSGRIAELYAHYTAGKAVGV